MKKIIAEKLYAHPIANVWEALTQSGAIAEWFLMKADFQPIKGYKYRLESTHPTCKDIITGEVLEIDPPFRLKYSWKSQDMNAHTYVTWSLKETGKETLLTLEHDGFENLGGYSPESYESFNVGWKEVAMDLDKYLSKKINA